MSVIKFNYQKPVRILNVTGVKALLSGVVALESKSISTLNYIFCSDEYLLEINQSFLHHDDLTDIITFDLSEDENISGEIYISVDRVRENAKHFDVTINREIMRVILHGVLHLCGYKDKTKSEITIMRAKEEHYLQMFEKN